MMLVRDRKRSRSWERACRRHKGCPFNWTEDRHIPFPRQLLKSSPLHGERRAPFGGECEVEMASPLILKRAPPSITVSKNGWY